MTRKDYIELAAALKSVQPWSVENRRQHMQDVRAIAEALAADNPRFDYGRFYEAAGLVQTAPGEYHRSTHECGSACDCVNKSA